MLNFAFFVVLIETKLGISLLLEIIIFVYLSSICSKMDDTVKSFFKKYKDSKIIGITKNEISMVSSYLRYPLITEYVSEVNKQGRELNNLDIVFIEKYVKQIQQQEYENQFKVDKDLLYAVGLHTKEKYAL